MTSGKRSTSQLCDEEGRCHSVSCQPKEPLGYHLHNMHAQQSCRFTEILQGPTVWGYFPPAQTQYQHAPMTHKSAFVAIDRTL